MGLLGCGAAAAAFGDDGSAESRAFVETSTPRTRYYVHEPIPLTLRFGVDGPWFRTNAVQPYLRELGLPVHLRSPAIVAPPGTAVRPVGSRSGSAGGRRVAVALGDGVTEAVLAGERVQGGRTFTVYEVAPTFVADRAGEIVVPAPSLSFTYATQFDEDLVHGRVPRDQRDAVVTGAPLTITIRALPEEGRPREFGGAVGTFTVTTQASSAELVVGTSFKLVLRIEGEGNLATFDTPRLGDLPVLAQFHVLGAIDDHAAVAAAVRTIAYDVAPLSDAATEVPSIPFAFFDTQEPAAYRVARTTAIPIRVRPDPGAGGGAVRTDPPEGARQEGGDGSDAALRDTVLWAVVIAVLGIGAVLWRTRPWRRRADPAELRARGAAAAFRARVAAPGADLSDAFAEYLAARLDCAPAAVIGPELRARLTSAGAPAELAARAAALLERLVADRYRAAGDRGPAGAAAGRDVTREAHALVGALDAAFTSAGNAG